MKSSGTNSPPVNHSVPSMLAFTNAFETIFLELYPYGLFQVFIVLGDLHCSRLGNRHSRLCNPKELFLGILGSEGRAVSKKSKSIIAIVLSIVLIIIVATVLIYITG